MAKLARGALPVPERFRVCGLFEALSVRTKDAVRFPGPAGVKVMVIVQLPFAGTELPQVLVSEKSPVFAPATVMPVIVNGVLPVLLSVRFWEEPAAPTV